MISFFGDKSFESDLNLTENVCGPVLQSRRSNSISTCFNQLKFLCIWCIYSLTCIQIRNNFFLKIVVCVLSSTVYQRLTIDNESRKEGDKVVRYLKVHQKRRKEINVILCTHFRKINKQNEIAKRKTTTKTKTTQ